MPHIRTLLLFSLLGCVASPSPKPIDAGGAGGAAGAGGARGGGGAGGAPQNNDPAATDPRPADTGTAGDTPPASACPENPPARLTDGAIVTLPIDVVLAGAPMKFGEPNPVANGATVTPLNLRFYLSGVSLVKTDGSAVPVNIVKVDGSVAPYDVHFFNAEETASAELRLRVPAGDYRELSFAFGLEDRCNAGPPERKPPMSAASQMTWPHGFGYLFLRYESRVAPGGMKPADAGVAGIPDGVHMGGLPNVLMAPTIRVPLTLTVGGSGAVTKRLRFVMDEMFKGALMTLPSQLPTNIPHPPGMESALGENLRQTAPMLPVFVVAP
jgi:hypothetical protein